MILKEKVQGFSELAELVKNFSLKLLSDSYKNGSCNIGNNGGEILSERESLFTVELDNFNNEQIKLIQNGSDGGHPYYLIIQTNGDINSKYELGLMLDDLEEYLPKQMIKDLDTEFYKFSESFSD